VITYNERKVREIAITIAIAIAITLRVEKLYRDHYAEEKGEGRESKGNRHSGVGCTLYTVH